MAPSPAPSRVRLPLVVALALAAYALALAAAGALLPHETREWVYSESGWLERGSIALWLALAVVIFVRLRPPTIGSIAGVLVCLGCAAREADLHKRFTDYSVLKVGYYFKDEFPVSERALFLVFSVALLASLITVVATAADAARRAGRPAPAWLKATALGAALLAAGKAMDRIPGMIKDLNGHILSMRISGPLKMLEEGLELMTPAVFGAAVWMYGAWRRDRAASRGGGMPAERRLSRG